VATVGAIVWHVTTRAKERCERPVCIGVRTRQTIVSYPAMTTPSDPERFLHRLLAAAAGDLYQWVSGYLQRRPDRRDALQPKLLEHGWIEAELDAAHMGVMIPFAYFEHRPTLPEPDREAIVRGYAREQALLI
jgi:hypothetical protein